MDSLQPVFGEYRPARGENEANVNVKAAITLCGNVRDQDARLTLPVQVNYQVKSPTKRAQ